MTRNSRNYQEYHPKCPHCGYKNTVYVDLPQQPFEGRHHNKVAGNRPHESPRLVEYRCESCQQISSITIE